MALPLPPSPTPAPDGHVPHLPSRADLLSTDWWHDKADHFVDWLTTSGLHIVLILVLLLVGLRLMRRFVRRMVQIAVRPRGNDALRDLMASKRQATLTGLFDALSTILLVTVALLMILQELGLAVAPLLASAGIAGIAIGFGAQSLVKDILSGAFIIMEQQFSVGDVIRASSVSGAVEEINLRTVVLRDGDGAVHIIPNGQITQVSVLTRDWSRLVLDLDIAYSADIDAATKCLQKVFGDYAAAHPDYVLEPPEVLGVESLAESSVRLRVWMKVLPGKQWSAARELRGQVKKAFDAAGIEIPFPTRTLWIKNEQA